MVLWMWIFFFPLFVSLIGLIGGVFFLNSSYLISWSIVVFREVSYEMLFLVDSFSMIFLFTVGLVSSFVLLYSNCYMEGGLMKKKFVVILMFFIISMFVLSMSGDLFWLMVGWDGLGFSSMCLIFFFQNWKSLNSSMVTFISNRIGDFFIISFICFILLFNGSLFYESEALFSFGLFLCLGAFSKSAQVPFSAWLPLAMAAPTPVSSLVHSSTLVTAGVFLLIRFKSYLNEDLFKIIYLISFLTILLAGMSSVGEYDLKKVIALSTLSHIGLMMMFVGMESFVSAKIHLVIHAFFKSLLFMISGFVIHDNNNFQDIRLVSVSSNNDFFSLTFLLSLFSMMGAPFFSGFFSKEILLMSMFSSLGSVLNVLLFFFSVSMTCSYSIRLMYYYFFPSFPFLPLICGNEYPMKLFFFMSLVSSFFSGVVVFSLVSKEMSMNLTLFSFSQKLGLMVSMIFGMVAGSLFSLYFSFIKSWLVKMCHYMWMIDSVGMVPQKFFFDLSFFFYSKVDVKGMLDYFILMGVKLFSFISKNLISSIYLDPFIYFKVLCFLGMSLMFMM